MRKKFGRSKGPGRTPYKRSTYRKSPGGRRRVGGGLPTCGLPGVPAPLYPAADYEFFIDPEVDGGSFQHTGGRVGSIQGDPQVDGDWVRKSLFGDTVGFVHEGAIVEGDLTLLFWVFPEGTQTGIKTIWAWETTGSTGLFGQYDYDTEDYWVVKTKFGPADAYTINPMSKDAPHAVCVRWDSATKTLRTRVDNGADEVSVGALPLTHWQATSFSFPMSGDWYGLLSKVKMFNQHLTEEEITAYYAEGAP